MEAEGDASNGDKPRPPSKKPKANHWARDVSAYDILEPIGEGTYGKVLSPGYPSVGDHVKSMCSRNRLGVIVFVAS